MKNIIRNFCTASKSKDRAPAAEASGLWLSVSVSFFTNRDPGAVSADLPEQSAIQDLRIDPAAECAPPQDAARRESAAGEHRIVIACHLFGGIADMGAIVGTTLTDAVLAHREGEVRVVPAKPAEHVSHIGGKSLAVAVAAEKRRTKPMVRTQLIHAGSAASAGACR